MVASNSKRDSDNNDKEDSEGDIKGFKFKELIFMDYFIYMDNVFGWFPQIEWICWDQLFNPFLQWSIFQESVILQEIATSSHDEIRPSSKLFSEDINDDFYDAQRFDATTMNIQRMRMSLQSTKLKSYYTEKNPNWSTWSMTKVQAVTGFLKGRKSDIEDGIEDKGDGHGKRDLRRNGFVVHKIQCDENTAVDVNLVPQIDDDVKDDGDKDCEINTIDVLESVEVPDEDVNDDQTYQSSICTELDQTLSDCHSPTPSILFVQEEKDEQSSTPAQNEHLNLPLPSLISNPNYLPVLPPPRIIKTPPTVPRFWEGNQIIPWTQEDRPCSSKPIKKLKMISSNRSKSAMEKHKPFCEPQPQSDPSFNSSTCNLLNLNDNSPGSFRLPKLKRKTSPDPLESPKEESLRVPPQQSERGFRTKIRMNPPQRLPIKNGNRSKNNKSALLWIPIIRGFIKGRKERENSTKISPEEESDFIFRKSPRQSMLQLQLQRSDENLLSSTCNSRDSLLTTTTTAMGSKNKRRSPWIRFFRKWSTSRSFSKGLLAKRLKDQMRQRKGLRLE